MSYAGACSAKMHMKHALMSYCASLPTIICQPQDGGERWADSTAVAIPVGPNASELRYHKSAALHLWLFGYELPETVMALTKTALHVVTSTKKGEHASSPQWPIARDRRRELCSHAMLKQGLVFEVSAAYRHHKNTS